MLFGCLGLQLVLLAVPMLAICQWFPSQPPSGCSARPSSVSAGSAAASGLVDQECCQPECDDFGAVQTASRAGRFALSRTGALRPRWCGSAYFEFNQASEAGWLIDCGTAAAW